MAMALQQGRHSSLKRSGTWMRMTRSMALIRKTGLTRFKVKLTAMVVYEGEILYLRMETCRWMIIMTPN